MSVTVLIVNWNAGALLTRCLEHLERQTLLPDKIIVVDNASSDNSIAGADRFNNVVFRRLDSNIGFAAANNFVLSNCETEYVALLNPDAFPEKEWLERLIGVANVRPDISAFGSRLLCHGKLGILDGVGDIYHISGLVWREHAGKKQDIGDLVQREIFSPCAAAALYRKQALLDVNGFDEDFFCYVEDVDLGFRLRLLGHKAMYVPDATVEHVGSATTGGKHSDFAIYYGHRNLVWTYIKDMPGILFWVLLPIHIVMNLISVVWFVIHGKSKVVLRAKWDAIRGLRRFWAKRQAIQAGRIVSVWDIWRVLDKRLVPYSRYRSIRPRHETAKG